MTEWTDPVRGVRWVGVMPLGVRVVAYTPDVLDRQEASLMFGRILATKSRPISEAMPEFFVAHSNMGNTRVVPIRGWKDK